MSISSDPKVFGPGLWFSIHVEAYSSKTEIEKQNFVKSMDRISNSLPCLKCKDHCILYINSCKH